MYFTKSPIFSTTFRDNLNCHIAKKFSAPKPDFTCKCKLCYEEFPGFYFLRQYKNSHNGFQFKTSNVGPDDNVNEVDDAGFKEELRSCQHFPVDSELEKVRHKVFIYAKENFKPKILEEELNHFFRYFKCAAIVSLASGFNLKNIEDRSYR